MGTVPNTQRRGETGIDLTKNPDKMSEQELRNEVKERRARTDEFYKAAYQDGYSAGWHACGEKILEEMKVKKSYRRGT